MTLSLLLCAAGLALAVAAPGNIPFGWQVEAATFASGVLVAGAAAYAANAVRQRSFQLAGGGSVASAAPRAGQTQSGSRSNRGHSWRISFPRVWELFSFILPQETRERHFEPAYWDLLASYYAGRKYRTKWARRWLAFAFAFRTVLMILDCLRGLILERLLWLLPSRVRDWWMT